ncbi:MAG: DUF3566 domain-containing protein [Actinomycetaceae bacterium]|nr:DUF3566 domain-containing protein [Actinomycetaceae bacterium]
MSTSKAPASTAPNPAPPEPTPEAVLSKRPVGIRRVKMTISKVSPLSVLKIGFLMSVAIGVMIVIAMMFLWLILDSMHVFSEIEGLLETLNSESLLRLGEYLEFGRWMSFAVIVAIIDIVLFTALAAIGAVAYNLIASLVGGLRITVTDE